MRKSVAHNTIWLTGSLVAQKVLSFVYFAIIARQLGVEETGLYVFALAFTALFGIFADFGLTPVVIREVARERDHSQFSPDVKIRFTVSLRLKMLFMVLSAVLAVGFTKLLGYEERTLMLVLATTGVMMLDAVHVFAYGILRGVQNLRFEAMGMFFGQLLVVSLGGWVLFNGASLFLLVGALAVGSLFNVVNALYHVWKLGIRVPFLYRVTMGDVKGLISMAWPFAAAGILARGYAQIDVILLSKISGLSAVGLYAVPSKIVFAFQFIPIALAAALYPAMSRAFISSRDRLAKIVHISMTYLLLIAVPLIVILLTMSPLIVKYVFGEAYVSSVVLLQILSLSMLFGFIDFPIGSLLNAAHKQHLQTASMFITLVVNLVLNLILIPRYGALGATVAAVAGQTVLFASGMFFARHTIVWDLSSLFSRIGRVMMSGVLLGFVIYTTNPGLSSVLSFYDASGNTLMLFATLLGSLLGVGVLYIVCIFATRALSVSEVREFASKYLKRNV